ncbi:hypoxanthine-guanine phosphoribosyltransferase [Motiliproteus sp. SC1-56]|uniref:hypoxanthine-guanine phosphoribosyltransferase n=1 Tax=Motiliproteus sp. SC1-56 TaxID=2799565 RepID=UPI001A8C76BC|nr:hypoxanthine-guanine phosphoribosyltransferase [Motiliproteus sp. SC1-56]
MTPLAAEAARVHAEADCLATPAQLDSALEQMAGEIRARLHDKAPLVLCVMNGGLIPAALLTLKLDFPLELDYLHATRYGLATEGGELDWRVFPKAEISGRSILVIDDIFDQGHTLAAICDYLKNAGAAEVLSATVINKRHERKVDFKPDFIGLEIEDRFLYGFGMDYKGYLRNVQGIYAVKGL